MIRGFEQATFEVRKKIDRNISWFTPAEERHFDPVTVVMTLTTVLLTAFLAGFTEEATNSSKEAGKTVFRRLKGLVIDIFGGKKMPENEDMNLLASKASGLVQSVERDKMLTYVTRSENNLRLYLEIETNMPPDRASELAAAIRESAVKHILMV